MRNFIKRNTRKLAIVIIIFYFVAIPFLNIIILGNLKAQVNTQAAVLRQTQAITAQLKKNSDQRTTQIATINRHLDCIVAFFSQPDRTTKAIANIDSCTLSTSEQLNLPASSSGSEQNSQVTVTTPEAFQQSQPTSEPQQPQIQEQPTFIQSILSSTGGAISGLLSMLK